MVVNFSNEFCTPNHYHDKPVTITELVAALPTLHPTKACNIYRLMRSLLHSGFFSQQKLGDGNGDMADEDEYKGGLEGLNSLVDIGGGIGALGKAIAEAFPDLDCTVFDLPRVVVGLQDSGNLTYVGGNIFDEVSAADVVLLKSFDLLGWLIQQWILHDWNDDECVKILKRCKDAISRRDKEGGKVIIKEMVVMKDEEGKDEAFNLMETQLFIDMMMMVLVLVTEKERDEEE
ncbi:hypothetical protein V6N11_070437 [Hibiscus sabdariffa]|uniref:O-methyltransferase C-terminal domain-containing protein n=1 Tax=Hibiscus sabdariffa TaxID=183260 RepID=A0ABR2QEZ8_9ROSI